MGKFHAHIICCSYKCIKKPSLNRFKLYSIFRVSEAEVEITAGHIYEGGRYVNELAIDWFLRPEETNQLQDR